MRYFFSILLFVAAIFQNALGQVSHPPKKYQGLLWEITGPNLIRPSYLFGTMHVSSKLAFHLSDSFYYALKQVDAVALELNPDVWQGQMVRLNQLNENYAAFTQVAGNDYISQNSFRIDGYEANLKAALSTEPPVVNSLLYRSYKTRDDFEEDTFLDLYIFQAGRKLGKAAAGVENYYESEKLVLEAYGDMANERKRKSLDLDGETIQGLLQKLQQAYRYGDLDLMDSIDNVLEKSPAFREKFLFKRNEIQADAIDSILKNTSLFAGVGAAHLPGPRGVIELLRSKGYKLRAVKMTDRDALQKDAISQLKVPVTFTTQRSPDGFYSVAAPGPLYAIGNKYQQMSRSQFADMSNGAYYLVSRVKTYATLKAGQGEVQKKLDSLLYENIPGTILSKKPIVQNGFEGYAISNRTRRGDLQRYQLYITPFEIIIFKMSGKADYVKGEEADRFFNSIQLSNAAAQQVRFSPAAGGFSVALPQEPHRYLNEVLNNRWEYEAIDRASGDGYLIFKTGIHNYHFLGNDSFDLSLMETSFGSSEALEKPLSRAYSTIDGAPALLVTHQLKNGQLLYAAHIIKGAQHFVFAHRSQSKARNLAWLKTIRFIGLQYPAAGIYEDSFLLVNLRTSVVPEIDHSIRAIIKKAANEAAAGNNSSGYISYWKSPENAVFASTETGEQVFLQMQEFPAYYTIKDSAAFWQKEINECLSNGDMRLHNKHWFYHPDGSKGYRLEIRDTGSSRALHYLLMQKGRHFFTVSSITDTSGYKSNLHAQFFGDFLRTHHKFKMEEITENRVGLFVQDLFSADSLLQSRARQAVGNLDIDAATAPLVFQALQRLSVTHKNYYETKAALIEALGFAKDTSGRIPGFLKSVYEQTADTSLFQNAALMALARLKTNFSFAVLKELLLADPPIFENSGEYDIFFDHIADSLALSKQLFPGLLQLAGLSDYKEAITGLLVKLVDSGFFKASDYASHLPAILIDAKIALKKQQAAEDRVMNANNKRDPEDEDDMPEAYAGGTNSFDLKNYGVLLMPFYEQNKNIPAFFERLLKSKDEVVAINAAAQMLKHKRPVSDSLLYALAAQDRFRGLLYKALQQAAQPGSFPKKFNSQLALARSFLVMENDFRQLDSVAFLTTRPATVFGQNGLFYFFKYRIKRSDEWKIGISGLQPHNNKLVQTHNQLISLTNVKIVSNKSLDEQLDLQLKKIVFPAYKSGKYFFTDENEYLYSKYPGAGE